MHNDERVRLILGGPGSGKTTFLLDTVEREIADGVSPRDIAFVSFTKAAANEAAKRAAAKFGFGADELPWFRTIHSLAYQNLALSRDEVIDRRDYREFGELVGERLTGAYDTDSPVPTGGPGDIMLRICDYAGTTGLTLEDAWHELNEAIDWHALKRFDAAYRGYKADMGKIDFTDMLLLYAEQGDPLNIEVAIIDEAQDLTPAQWRAAEHAFSRAKRIYICGDDDQAIYKWAGADVNYFLNISKTPQVLPFSHRLPVSVYELANEVAGRISRRYTKVYKPTDREGTVSYHHNPEGVDLSEGSWLLLARNKYKLIGLEEMVRDQGVNYRTKSGNAIDKKDVEVIVLWERIRSGKITNLTAAEVRLLHKAIGLPVPALREVDDYDPKKFFSGPMKWPWYDALANITQSRRDYYMACIRRGEKITAEPRIRIETIHGVKGAEADHVLLLSDMSTRTAVGYDQEPDSEHRVFYVGITRARKSLHIIMPQGGMGYPL